MFTELLLYHLGMPETPEQRRTRMREYMRTYRKREYPGWKAKLFEHLGGKCARCTTTEDLHIDHIDAKTKSFDPAQFPPKAWNRVVKELKKCQLLCKPCHREKTTLERGQTPAQGTHGTLSSYRYCKCELCRAAKAKWTREYRRNTPRS